MTYNVFEVDEDKMFYSGDDLGFTFDKENINYRIWSPPAEKVYIDIYSDDRAEDKVAEYKLEQSINGTWQVKLTADIKGNYYKIRLKKESIETSFVDPWVKAVGTNSRCGLIVDPSEVFPPTWSYDKKVELNSPVDAVIYELHVKDFSISKESGIRHKGKYTAFTERHTTNREGLLSGLAHLKELGITHVHLLPVFDFATADDMDINSYNWGYDPLFYMVPEGSYASNPANESRIYEFKKMVKVLHSHDIGVIMDVVYNHTYQTESSPFEILFPDYFYRFDRLGKFANASGVGNEIASERPMMRKYIIDSLLYWSREYHIDGFRFDLMSAVDKKTILQAAERLKKENDSIIIYGEPWTALPPQLEKHQIFKKGSQKGTDIAVFNDNFRNTIKGDNDGQKKGFIQGKTDLEKEIYEGVIGSVGFPERSLYGFTQKASETINYADSHDNLTLWDKLAFSCPGADEKTRRKMHRLAMAVLFTSQGVPFIQAGTEFLRTKFGDKNSYNSGIFVNQLKWERKTTYNEHFNYIKGLINLRSHHPAFRMINKEEIRKKIKFIQSPVNTVGFYIDNHANGDGWEKVAVFYNPNHKWTQFNLPQKRTWAIVVDDKEAGTEPIRIFYSDEVQVPPLSAMVIYSAALLTGC
ncbi:pullulanase [Halanaerobium sp. DL-01]|uniref:type I pullulanase n=1 Tax=Halanaerobium sp. DL-01 TaxID=1653064 RepID=UPI000E1A8C8A|nr:type I pullulanase [Halanaerobium sp. DL-01]RCW88496.1 pullulanase [Halanaerobium sp. DL-01]